MKKKKKEEGKKREEKKRISLHPNLNLETYGMEIEYWFHSL